VATDVSNHLLRSIDGSGTVGTLAGSGVAGVMDGVGLGAAFSSPQGVGGVLANTSASGGCPPLLPLVGSTHKDTF
jgi:hypothetical protein